MQEPERYRRRQGILEIRKYWRQKNTGDKEYWRQRVTGTEKYRIQEDTGYREIQETRRR